MQQLLPDLKDGVGYDNVVHAVLVVHGGVHSDLKPVEDQGSQTKH